MRREHTRRNPLANHKSALKRHRQSQKRAARNRSARTRIKNVVKSVRVAVQNNDTEAANTAFVSAQSVLGKYAGKTVHWKNAARKVSRLAKAVNALQRQEQ